MNSQLLQRLINQFETIAVISRAIDRPPDRSEATDKPRETNCFRQNLSIAVQRGNAFSKKGEVLEGRGSPK